MKPTKREHNFIDLQKSYSIETAVSTGDDLVTFRNDGPKNHKVLDDFIDDSHDMVIIKLHGHKAEGDAPASSVRLHHICHQEFVYDETTMLSKYHTRTTNAPGAVRAANRALQRQAASAYKMVA